MPTRLDSLEDSSGPLDRQLLEKELASVYEVLKRYQNKFYQKILAIPGINPKDLPLVIQSQEGIRDQFSSDINYYFYPWLFSDVFQDIDNDHLESLCVIAQLFAESLIQLDKVMDDQLHFYPEIMRTVVLLSSQHKLTTAIQKLSQLFDSNSPFWNRFAEFYDDYLCQVIREKADDTLTIPSISQMEKSAIGKVALSKIITAAMAELTGRKEVLPMLEKSQELFDVGYQLYDDVKDWQRDYKKDQYSYLLKKAFHRLDLVKDITTGKKLPIEDFGCRLHVSDILQDTLELAAGYLERAREVLGTIHCPRWVSWLQMEQHNMLQLRSDLIEIRKRAIEHAQLKRVPKWRTRGGESIAIDLKHCEKSITQGIIFLQQQQRKNYLEARHLEMHSKRSRQSRESACHWGTVFQRAVTIHTLAQARKAMLSVEDDIFTSDLQMLIDSRLQNRKGGWSYFPDMPELPPDCDDLAEVLHVLISVSHTDISSLCDEPIRLALCTQRDDGGISTWIADPSSPRSIKAQSDMHAVWGAEPNIEVMANFLYALWRYDYRRFENNISMGTSFIASRQSEDGSWASTWYAGPYYGTWICCRLLHAIGGYLENINRAHQFFLDTQNTDGSWGTNKEAVLNTAYALMTILRYVGERKPRVIESAAQNIIESQRENGSWNGSPFIRMNTARKVLKSRPGFQQQSYGSDTMSTAFAVRALLAFRESLL